VRQRKMALEKPAQALEIAITEENLGEGASPSG
jgi:hypothetical protein